MRERAVPADTFDAVRCPGTVEIPAAVMGRHWLREWLQGPGLQSSWPFGSRRAVLEPGDILIRDPALMHRGTVNRTDRPRTMLSICYFRAEFTHDYGRLELSLDRDLYERLAPEIRPLFASFASFDS